MSKADDSGSESEVATIDALDADSSPASADGAGTGTEAGPSTGNVTVVPLPPDQKRVGHIVGKPQEPQGTAHLEPS